MYQGHPAARLVRTGQNWILTKHSIPKKNCFYSHSVKWKAHRVHILQENVAQSPSYLLVWEKYNQSWVNTVETKVDPTNGEIDW
jgi:hypothetical protein